MDTSPKIAIVTGAGSGIGKYVAVGLAQNGYSVVLAGRRNHLRHFAVRSDLNHQPGPRLGGNHPGGISAIWNLLIQKIREPSSSATIRWLDLFYFDLRLDETGQQNNLAAQNVCRWTNLAY